MSPSRTTRSSTAHSLSPRDAWILIAIVIFICVSCWEASIVQSKDGLNLGDYSFEFSVKSNDDVDAIAIYTHEMDLSKVPPKGSPPNLPAERASSGTKEMEEIGKIRKTHGYGGSGDKTHLGGFTTVDRDGISPYVWRDMMEYFGVKKLLDVGCGRGISTSWFYMQGVQVQCVEGSHDAIERSLLPALVEEDTDGKNAITKDNIIVEHDFSLGPWWPEETVDAVWCVELLEHVSRNFAPNYLTAFKKSALIFATHSIWGGWHHTEVHDETWWKSKFEMHGFVYSEELTKRIRQKALDEKDAAIPLPFEHEDNKIYRSVHVIMTMKVFINPAVASRPEHAHLLSEPGCYDDTQQVHCGEEKNKNSRLVNSKLPESFKPIPYKEDKHKKWEEYLKNKVDEEKDKAKN